MLANICMLTYHACQAAMTGAYELFVHALLTCLQNNFKEVGRLAPIMLV